MHENSTFEMKILLDMVFVSTFHQLNYHSNTLLIHTSHRKSPHQEIVCLTIQAGVKYKTVNILYYGNHMVSKRKTCPSLSYIKIVFQS